MLERDARMGPCRQRGNQGFEKFLHVWCFELLKGACLNFFPARCARHIFLMIFFLRSRTLGSLGFSRMVFAYEKKGSKNFLRSPSARGFETAELFNFFESCKTWVALISTLTVQYTVPPHKLKGVTPHKYCKPRPCLTSHTCISQRSFRMVS